MFQVLYFLENTNFTNLILLANQLKLVLIALEFHEPKVTQVISHPDGTRVIRF